MKLMFLVWRSQNQRELDNPAVIRKKLTTFYILFCTFPPTQTWACSSTWCCSTSSAMTSGSSSSPTSCWCPRSSTTCGWACGQVSSFTTSSATWPPGSCCRSTSGAALRISLGRDSCSSAWLSSWWAPTSSTLISSHADSASVFPA
jgi:hypothetical protein